MELADSSVCLTYESGPAELVDFPQTDEPVHILGNAYSTFYDLDELKADILSRIWITYRKNFSPIGGTGPTTDTGWGCMLRCGQMMMAQCLVIRHLGRDWRWSKDSLNDPVYRKVLSLFQDKRTSYYSIHQIASMGVSEGKTVGSWFGPNTIAQVLKKLSVYDEWSAIVTHVAMDNTIIEDDIRTLCKNFTANRDNGQLESKSISDSSPLTAGSSLKESSWSPLLLIIPLRLGLTDINSLYFNSLKMCLSLKQSVGIIGGKPNHAHWFVGTFEDELIYLDPHTTQPVVDIGSTNTTGDESYHCCHASRMKLNHLDPSVALVRGREEKREREKAVDRKRCKGSGREKKREIIVLLF
ncbi:Hypothetical predicted protein [Octopus vulgaris]|uniref:Cysteine protease n=1 Tax=Octopus vulgaris TaxID=6645 RepID=A0AA36FL21_OCTVU|nr:Hypothetical predicted protein [Octopus vulgaris]